MNLKNRMLRRPMTSILLDSKPNNQKKREEAVLNTVKFGFIIVLVS